IPEAVVIGYDGRTVYRGPCAKPDQGPNPVARIRTAILEDLARRKSGWGASSAMRSARSLIWHHGTLAAARQRLLRHTPSPPTQDDYDRCLGELELAFKNRLRRIRTDTADGRWLRAQAAGAQLAADSKGWETREDVALEAMRSLSAPSARAHFVLERKLEDVLRGVRARGPRARDANLLRRMLRSTPAGAVQDRVKRWIAWIDAAATRRGR
ncbi:MAG: hypothetical protein CMJ83_22450, partial [Planctomycetes bacterium]|nr:hypothetical protein [Planctomycetota bacterium]